MSVQLMSLVWEAAPQKNATLLTLLALADVARDEGLCYPSMQRLAELTRQTERNAQRCVKALIDEQYLLVESQGLGRGNAARYLINIDKLLDDLETACRKDPKKKTTFCRLFQRLKGDNFDGKGDKVDIPIMKNHYEPSDIRSRGSLDAVIKPFAEELYAAYPRHVGKGAAIKAIISAWKRLMNGESSRHTFHNSDAMMKFLLPKVIAFAASRQDQDEKFTPYPATWFNQSRYLDGDQKVSNETSLFDVPKTEQAEVAISAVEKVRQQLARARSGN